MESVNLVAVELQLIVQTALGIPEGELDGALRFLTTFQQIGDDAGSEAVEGSTTTQHIEGITQRLQILLTLAFVPFLDGLVDERQFHLTFLVHQTETLALHLLLIFLTPRLELRHLGAHHIRQHHRRHSAYQSTLGISEEGSALVGRSTHHHIVIEGDLTRERILRDAMLTPRFVVVSQTEQVVLLRPCPTLVVLQNGLNLRGIGEQMLAFGIEGTLQECRHTDVGFDDANLGAGILHLLTVFLGQRVFDFLLPFHLVLLDDGVHQQLELSVDERFTSGLRSLDIDDETG